VKRGWLRVLRGLKRHRTKLRVLWDAINRFDGDHGFLLSSGIAFSLLFCLIPLILVMLGLIGSYLYSDREILNHIRRYLESMFPSLDPRIMRNILTIVRDHKIVGIVGTAGLIWTSTWVFNSLRTALNVVFKVEKRRGRIRGLAVDLLMILLVGGLLLLTMSLTSMVSYLQASSSGFPFNIKPALRFLLRYFLPFLFTFWMFFLIYKIAPDRNIHHKTALHATLFTSFLWEVAKQCFGWYVLHMGRFSTVYGSLGTLAIFLFWMYYSSVILLLGGEIAFLLEQDRGYALPKNTQRVVVF
jgi:membrane protein